MRVGQIITITPVSGSLEEAAKMYADEVCPFVWPTNKKGEKIEQRVGQNAPGSGKHHKEQEKLKAAFLAGAAYSDSELDRMGKLCMQKDGEIESLKNDLAAYVKGGEEKWGIGKEDHTYPDLSNIDQEEKKKLVEGYIELCALHAMRLFYAIGLKTHMESKVVNDPTSEEFYFFFGRKEMASPTTADASVLLEALQDIDPRKSDGADQEWYKYYVSQVQGEGKESFVHSAACYLAAMLAQQELYEKIMAILAQYKALSGEPGMKKE